MARGKSMPIEQQLEMWELLRQVQETFPDTEEGFHDFATYVINMLIPGAPDLARVQAEMCKFLFSGPKYRMIQAQRGQAKTTLCAIRGVFKLIHNPTARILILSAGGKMAKEIANWIIQIIEGLEILHVLIPDKNAGDRASVEAYDVHWVFRGAEKAPSVKCLGVDANVQGSRADILIADDIESMKNARTVTNREILVELTKEFATVCQNGEIIYLGTPQTSESIYRDLPARGYTIRIWPGRYPTLDQEDAYNGWLCPTLVEDMRRDPTLRTGGGLNGRDGQVTCPEMFSNRLLMEKELELGAAKFQLQYMLNTDLSDIERYPLKISNLIVCDFSAEMGPVAPVKSNDFKNNVINNLIHSGNKPTDKYMRPANTEFEWRPFERTIMYIDPAGGGKNSNDETAYAIVKLLGAFVYIVEVSGIPGGYDLDKLSMLVDAAKRHNCKEVWFEKNFGNGSHRAIMEPLFQAVHPVQMEEHWATGQKELRIIDTIEPLLSSGRLVIHPEAIAKDHKDSLHYPAEKRVMYTLAHQISNITRAKGCLVHDDRADALAGALYQIVQTIDYDTISEMARRAEHEHMAWLDKWKNPQNYREDVSPHLANGRGSLGNALSGF